MREPLRSIRLTPYISKDAPSFTLRTFDTGRIDSQGRYYIAYELRQRDRKGHRSEVLFEGADFCCSPLHAIDSDACLRALLSFLTLRPGDTDESYFDGYTERQRQYAATDAEALSAEVYARFGED